MPYAPRHNGKTDDQVPGLSYSGPTMLDEAQLAYMTEVLGVTHVISDVTNPSPSAVTVEFGIEGSPSAPIAVLVDSPEVSTKERELLSKILKAIGVQSELLVSVPENIAEPDLWPRLETQIDTNHFIYFSKEQGRGEVLSPAGLKVLKTLNLRQMLEGSEPSIQENKKQVWAELKGFVKELDHFAT